MRIKAGPRDTVAGGLSIIFSGGDSVIMKKSKFMKKVMIFGYIAVFAGGALTLWGSLASMAAFANAIGDRAADVYHKDKVESLLLLLDSERHSVKDKNDAIWALGVLKDKRALARLESMAADEKSGGRGKPCPAEIEKSILKIKGKFIFSWPMQCK